MELPEKIAVMTLTGATLFPQALLPLFIFEPRYRQMLADALRTHRMFSVAMQRPGQSREQPCDIAGLGLIRVSVDHEDGTSHLILQGVARVALGEPVQLKPYRMHPIRALATVAEASVPVHALSEKVLDLVRVRMDLGGAAFPFPLGKSGSPIKAKTKAKSPKARHAVQDVIRYLQQLPHPEQLADLVACAMLPDPQERQVILEAVELELRFKHLIHFLMEEISRARKDSPP